MKKNISLDKFIGDFKIVPMETNTDRTVLTVEQCRNKILSKIDYNIGNFRNNLWARSTNVHKILTEIDRKQHLCIFTVRLGNTEIYKCNLVLSDLIQKLEFLAKFYEAVSNGCLDKSILSYIQERQVKLEERRKKQAKVRKEKRVSEREIKEQREAEIIKHLPKIRCV